ncbi:MAG: glycosyltransferase [Planctomycetota bacterium]|nr:MAG: glycosyltransferase [Planctomycetota bacterium]
MRVDFMKTRVLILTLDSPHLDRRTLLFAQALQQEGFEVCVLTPYAKAEEGFEDIHVVDLIQESSSTRLVFGLKEWFKRWSPCWVFRFLKRCYKTLFTRNGHLHLLFTSKMLERAKEFRPSVVIASDLPTLPLAWQLKRTLGSRLIYDSHEFYTEQAFLSSKDKRELRKIEARLLPWVDLLITINGDIAQLFRRRYGVGDVRVIQNAFLSSCPEKKYIHDLLGIGRERRLVLYQGQFLKYRNLEQLVKLARYFREIALVLVGWGELEAVLKKRCRRYGILDKTVYFLPKIPQRDLVAYASSASLGVIPYPSVDLNTRYCTPNKLFEFISASLPVVANENLVMLKKILRRYGIGFCLDFHQAEAAAKKIEEVASETELLRLYRNNLELAKRELCWERERKKLVAWVNGLFAKRAKCAE